MLLGGNAFADYETEYDEGGRVVKSTDPEGAVTSYGYSLNGNVTKVTDALGNETLFTYDSMNRVATMEDARGAITAYAYTATGQVATITDALGGVRSYQYDLLDRLVSETDETNKATSYTYDALGRALTVTNPLGHTDSFTYDLLGRIKTVTDKKGNTTSYNYDASGNIIETIDALGNSSHFEYDAASRLVSQSYPNGWLETYAYDSTNRMVLGANEIGEASAYNYNGLGHLVSNTWTVKKNAYGYTGVFDLDGLYTFDDFVAAYGADAEAYVLGVIYDINANISVSGIGGSQIPINQGTTETGDQPLVIALDLDTGLDEGADYAKARMYDAADRRFMAVDMHPSNLAVPQSFNAYLYVMNNPVIYIDLFGLALEQVEGGSITIG